MDIADDRLHAWTLPDSAGNRSTASAGPEWSGIGGVELEHFTLRGCGSVKSARESERRKSPERCDFDSVALQSPNSNTDDRLFTIVPLSVNARHRLNRLLGRLHVICTSVIV